MAIADDMDESKILERLVEIVDCDIRELFDDQDNILPFDKVPDHVRRCIVSFDVTESDQGVRTTRIRMESKIDAIERIGYLKHIRAFCDCASFEVLGEDDS